MACRTPVSRRGKNLVVTKRINQRKAERKGRALKEDPEGEG